MKKITCIQQYVIDNLIEDKKLSINSLLDATSKVCSKEQFDNILFILIETPTSCINKENLKDRVDFVRMSICIPEEANSETKIRIIKILMDQFSFGLKQTKEYIDSCIGKYSVLPKVVRQEEIDEITKKLKPYNVNISTTGFY